MAEMPTCRRCGNPHWRFQSCDKAAATPTVKPTPVQREFSVPEGYVRVGANKFARATTSGCATKPTYIQIAPNKFRKAA